MAKDARYEEWIVNFILLRDLKAAVAVAQNYEVKYGFDKNLIRMKFKSGLIDEATAKSLRTQYFEKQSDLANQKKSIQFPNHIIYFKITRIHLILLRTFNTICLKITMLN